MLYNLFIRPLLLFTATVAAYIVTLGKQRTLNIATILLIIWVIGNQLLYTLEAYCDIPHTIYWYDIVWALVVYYSLAGILHTLSTYRLFKFAINSTKIEEQLDDQN